MRELTEQIINVERAALDRWGKGDPAGYLEIMAPELTYFDPFTEQRVDGDRAMRDYLAPVTGQIHIDHYEMINPKVQHYGDVAILTFNLEDMVKEPGSDKTVTLCWNSTEVYRRNEGTWKIVHSHWSYTKPELKSNSDE
jgi:ketosteroid isomerase-like protein